MKKAIIAFLFCMSFGFLSAQDNNDLLQKLVEKNVLTQSEADQLKKEQKPTIAQTAEKVRNLFNSPYIQIGGNGQMMYKYTDVSKIKHDFKPKNLFISLNGKINDSFRYGFLLEFTNPSVQEFWGEWTAVQQFNLKLGQFKVPITLESQYVPATLETVAYSRTISNLFGYAGEDDVLNKQNGKNNFGRDAGVQISGELLPLNDLNLLQYSIGMFQGMGVTTGEKNNTKDFAGTLMLQPVKGLRIGGGAYFGQASYSLDKNIAPEQDHVRNRWIASADYKSDRFSARTEWIKANDGGIDKEGLYGMALYYLVPKKLNALVKADYYNANKKVNNEVMDYTVGFNYYFAPSCRIQLNYTYSDFAKKSAPDTNTVLVQLQIGF